MSEKQKRQAQIRDLLARNEVQNQAEIIALLAAEGIQTTQATLSRDLRDLGIGKKNKGYELPASDADFVAKRRNLRSALRGLIAHVERGGTLVVIHTRPGQGMAVAQEMIRSHLHEVLGAIAGQDQVFIATQTSGQAKSLAKLLERKTERG